MKEGNIKISKVENRKTTEKMNETKSSLFEKINKIGKHLAGLTKKKRESIQIISISNRTWDITNSPFM